MSGREIATVIFAGIGILFMVIPYGAPLGVPFVVIAVFLLLAGSGRRRHQD